jgi:hypothetical protein
MKLLLFVSLVLISVRESSPHRSDSSVVINSRIQSGQSSFIEFPREFDRHSRNLLFSSSRQNDKRIMLRTVDDSAVSDSVNAFFDSYGAYLGVSVNDLAEYRIDMDSGSGCSFHRYQQTILGYPVYAGTIIVIVGSHGGVVEAHGHAALEADIPSEYRPAKPLPAARIHQIVRAHVSSNYPEASCREEDLKLATVWFRVDLVQGSSGSVVLATHVDGRCPERRGRSTVAFDLFGKSNSNLIINL